MHGVIFCLLLFVQCFCWNNGGTFTGEWWLLGDWWSCWWTLEKVSWKSRYGFFPPHVCLQKGKIVLPPYTIVWYSDFFHIIGCKVYNFVRMFYIHRWAGANLMKFKPGIFQGTKHTCGSGVFTKFGGTVPTYICKQSSPTQSLLDPPAVSLFDDRWGPPDVIRKPSDRVEKTLLVHDKCALFGGIFCSFVDSVSQSPLYYCFFQLQTRIGFQERESSICTITL